MVHFKRNIRGARSLLTGLLQLAFLAGTAGAQPVFTGLTVPPHPLHPASESFAISGDGTVVVGDTGDPFGFRWTIADGLVSLGGGGQPKSFAHGISADGFVIVGHYGDDPEGEYYDAFRWLPGLGFELLSPLDPDANTRATATSGTGTVSVGYGLDMNSRIAAIRWDSPGGPQNLGTLIPEGESRALGISAAGTVVAGISTFGPSGVNRAVCWRSVNGWAIEDLGALPGSPDGFSSADGVSSDGKVLVGGSNGHACRWVLPAPPEDLGSVPGASVSHALGVNGNGSVIVGWAWDGVSDNGKAMMWTSTGGMVDLQNYLAAKGVDLTGWLLTESRDVSDDGLSITGIGVHNGQYEAWHVKLDCIDGDGDGICDDWEINGVPWTDSQGVARRYILDVNGDGVTDANPKRKDLFVEIDSMPGREPVPRAIARVVEAFKRAPVPAPNIPGGKRGVALHAVIDETGASDYAFPNAFTEFQAFKATYFGTPAERAQFSAADFALMRAAKAKVYRYCIFAQSYSGTGSSGLAEGIWCDDFMVTLGHSSWQAGMADPEKKEDLQAGTFMHEFGHTLGLYHGGEADINFKPNYFSTMNYSWQLPDTYTPSGPGKKFRKYFPNYSDRVLPTLSEGALDEQVGVQGPYSDVRVQYRVSAQNASCPAGVESWATHGNTYYIRWGSMQGPVDWDYDCDFDTSPVAVEINDVLHDAPVAGQTLHGFDDWSNLKYGFKGSPHAAPGAIAPESGFPVEVDAEYAIPRLTRPAPPGCFTLTTTPDATFCPAGSATLVATPVGAGPFTFQWQSLTETGRFIADLTDGQFTDEVTGLTYSVVGSQSPSLTVSSASLGDHAPQLGFAVVVSSACGNESSDVIVLTVIIGQRCQPADVADDQGTPLPPFAPCSGNVPNSGVNEGDYNAFFQGFFDALPQCNIADDQGTPLPPFGPPITPGGPADSGVNEGDYNCFFQHYFDGCP